MNANNELIESFNLLTETLEGRTVDPYDNILVNIHDLSRCLDQVRKGILAVAPSNMELKLFDPGMYLPDYKEQEAIDEHLASYNPDEPDPEELDNHWGVSYVDQFDAEVQSQDLK